MISDRDADPIWDALCRWAAVYLLLPALAVDVSRMGWQWLRPRFLRLRQSRRRYVWKSIYR
jgi:hypothetical protein